MPGATESDSLRGGAQEAAFPDGLSGTTPHSQGRPQAGQGGQPGAPAGIWKGEQGSVEWWLPTSTHQNRWGSFKVPPWLGCTPDQGNQSEGDATSGSCTALGLLALTCTQG